MSTSKGSNKRSRPQKYQNRTSFKNTLYDKSDFQKNLNNLHVSEVCNRCKDVIEWKIKYKKYKPLSQPKTCIKCQKKCVKKAYHVMCRECALEAKVCAKCLKSGDEVAIVPPEPTQLEQQKLKVEMDRLIKSFSERKRRSFLRYMARGEKIERETEDNEEAESQDADENAKAKEVKRIPHTREALLKKIDELKLAEEDDDFNFSDDDEEGSCDDNDDNEWSDEVESEDEK